MEHNSLLHRPFAKGRIENGLAPAPRKMQRAFYVRWGEAVSVLLGRSVAVRCYEDMTPPEGEEFVDGTVGKHPVVAQSAAE